MSVGRRITIAVVLAAGPGYGGVAVGTGALTRPAVHPPFRAHTLLTRVHRAGEGLPVHKHTVFKGTVWKNTKHTHNTQPDMSEQTEALLSYGFALDRSAVCAHGSV